MKERKLLIVQLALVCLIIAGLSLTGCGGAKKAGGEPAQTKVAEAVPGDSVAENTPEGAETPQEAKTPEEEPTEAAGSAEEGKEAIENALENLLQLAPVHMKSSFVYKKGDAVESEGVIESDVDAQGNSHFFIEMKDSEKMEMYLVDGKLYIPTGEGQFVVMGDVPMDSTFSFLAIYGGAYLLAYDDLQGLKKTGSEEVNGFSADKYELEQSSTALGVAGALAGAEGTSFDYKGTVWVEKGSKAVVRVRIDWTSKASDATGTYHAEFDATKGTVEKITAPENVLSIGN